MDALEMVGLTDEAIEEGASRYFDITECLVNSCPNSPSYPRPFISSEKSVKLHDRAVALAAMRALVAEIEKHGDVSKIFEVRTIDNEWWAELKSALEEK